MNLADLEQARKENCTCGDQYLWFRLHEVDCPFHKIQLEIQKELLGGNNE
jgi:hypothetical protein